MKTAFLGQAYRGRSPILASQTAINVYLEQTSSETPGSNPGGFYGTAGLKSVYQGPTAEGRGLWVAGTGIPGEYALFAVIGQTLYQFDEDYNATNVGFVGGAGPVSMVDNGTQIAVFHSTGAIWAKIKGGTSAPIVGAPAGGIASYNDDYVVFSENIGGEFGITAAGDLSTIDPLDVATAEGWPDDCVAVMADHRLAWLMGTETIEIWSDTGAALFPYERIPGGFIELGCAARFSVAKLDNSVFLLGRDKHGAGIVYRINDFIPQRISTHAIEYALRQAGDISDAIGFAYQEEGHLFYQLTLPTLDQTWVYDVATGPNGAWHQKASTGSDGLLHRHRAAAYAFFYGDHLVLDYENGKIYRQSLDYTTEDGTPIYRERAWEVATDETEDARVRIDYLRVVALAGDGAVSNVDEILLEDQSGPIVSEDGRSISLMEDSGPVIAAPLGDQMLEDGSGPVMLEDGSGPLLLEGNPQDPPAPLIWLQISRDGGQSWGYERFQKLGKIGKRKAQARWRRLGIGRATVLRVATNMTGRVSWTGAYMKATVLSL